MYVTCTQLPNKRSIVMGKAEERMSVAAVAQG